jgi:hypothetical protein
MGQNAAHGETGATNPTDNSSSSYFQWRPVGKAINASDAYLWSVTIPSLPAGSKVNKVFPDDMIIGSVGIGNLFMAGTDPFTISLSLTAKSTWA